MAMDICAMNYTFVGDDGNTHDTICILDPDHASKVSQTHQDASGFTWTRNLFAPNRIM